MAGIDPRLFDEVAATLFRLDPIDIHYETNTDEYQPEVEPILPRLADVRDVLGARKVIHEEFVRRFSVSEVGPKENYTGAACDDLPQIQPLQTDVLLQEPEHA